MYTFVGSKQKATALVNNKEVLDSIFTKHVSHYVGYSKSTFEEDLTGVDVWVYKSTGNKLGVDLKSMYRAFEGSVPLETWSVLPDNDSGIVGWTRDYSKQTDVILWYWNSTRDYLILPYPNLREWFSKNWLQLSKAYRTAQQITTTKTSKWRSECVFVDMYAILDGLNLDEHKYKGYL